jgi:hypothetical protein
MNQKVSIVIWSFFSCFILLLLNFESFHSLFSNKGFTLVCGDFIYYNVVVNVQQRHCEVYNNDE